MEPVEVTITDRVARITLNRPDAGNALDRAACEGLENAARLIADAGHDVGCILLLANGKNFCVGGDAAFMQSAPTLTDGIRDLVEPLHRAIATLDDLGLPMVAGVRGAAAGAGLSLVALADYAVGADTAKFVMAYSAIGLTPDGGGSWSLTRAIGYRRVLELALTNRRLDASEALAWGLLNDVCEAELVDARATETAGQLARGATAALRTAKRLVRAGLGSTLSAQLDVEREAIVGAAGSADAAEGVTSLREKRPARFGGR